MRGVNRDLALREIKEYAIRHTEFYRDYCPEDVFPIMSKMDFVKNKEALTSNEQFLHPLHISSTSGSTGVPFSVAQNRSKRLRTIADLKVFGEYADYPSHEKMLQLRAYNGKPLDRSVDERENIWRYDIANLSDHDIASLLDFICQWQPNTVFGYTSTMETIANYILKHGTPGPISCKSVLVGAEALTDEIASKIMATFHCPVFDRYSNMEMGIYAQREYGKTNFRLNTASYFFEIVRLDCDEPAAEHEIGRIVVTDLYNHAFPMIRYDTGDLGCYCMNGAAMELEKVYGRKVDCVYSADNTLLSPHSITNGMWGIEGIDQWQFIQTGQGEYLLKLCAHGPLDEGEIRKRLRNVLGETACISFAYVDEIPVLNSQKRKYIKNEWRPSFTER